MYVKLSFIMMTKKQNCSVSPKDGKTNRKTTKPRDADGGNETSNRSVNIRAVTEKEHSSLDCRGRVWAVLERFTVSGGLSYPSPEPLELFCSLSAGKRTR